MAGFRYGLTSYLEWLQNSVLCGEDATWRRRRLGKCCSARLPVQKPLRKFRTQYNDELHMQSILPFLREWYENHIEDLDSKYGAWLNSRGIS